MLNAPTLGDVAKKAGVSKSTVSRVLNKTAKISETTRNRVLLAANELKYEPNAIAQSLTKRKTYTIGVILEDILNPFFTEVAKGIENTLKRAGYTMILTSSDYERGDEIRLTRMLIRYKVDGILITPLSADSEGIELLRMRRLPFFMMNCKSLDKNVNWIDSDNLEGGYIAARHLIELGHRKMLCIRSRIVEGARERFEGFKKALEDFRIALCDQITRGDARSRSDGYKIVHELLSGEGKEGFPTAIIAVNDAVAIGAMECLLEYGMRIPQDVSIIGYDDINVAALVRVPLTTVHQAKYKMGEIAAQQLLGKIESDDGVAQQFLVKPKLIIRESTGPVR
jgi:LacI family transcriptional regulator